MDKLNSKSLNSFCLGSAPCRTVLMTAAALNLKLNLKSVNLMKNEQMNPDFVKINPQHTIPTLVDNDFAVWESRVISIYLIEKYAKSDSLYPKDPQTRAVINQRLYFDMGTLDKLFAEYYFASFFGHEQTPERLQKFHDALELLNTFLANGDYAAGTDKLTVADLSLFASVSTFDIFDVDLTAYPRVEKWLNLMKETAPGRDVNADGVEQMRKFVQTMDKGKKN